MHHLSPAWKAVLTKLHLELSLGPTQDNRFFTKFGVYEESFACGSSLDERLHMAQNMAGKFYDEYVSDEEFEQLFEESLVSNYTFFLLTLFGRWHLHMPQAAYKECLIRWMRTTMAPIIVDTVNTLANYDDFGFRVTDSCIRSKGVSDTTLGEYFAKKLDDLTPDEVESLFRTLESRRPNCDGVLNILKAGPAFIFGLRDILGLEITE